ncbi:hypothetical protein BDU57DRAFT_514895 [Ampelomyces quisqualis]|uniref:Uncharacterized protein n=1 Tax=Ampelomyces quisqualis TaxID=50730 RepID=A0A6A5QS72_AMPQU|nr:hypothetical protein BDU57DRAFT_514895 [Ampelomyces quisqualis]
MKIKSQDLVSYSAPGIFACRDLHFPGSWVVQGVAQERTRPPQLNTRRSPCAAISPVNAKFCASRFSKQCGFRRVCTGKCFFRSIGVRHDDEIVYLGIRQPNA